jgi:hypothetical protein
MPIGQRILVNIINTLLGSWLLMLGVGYIHHEWIAQCPTISYWDAVIVDTLIGGWLCLAVYMTNYGSTQQAIKDMR